MPFELRKIPRRLNCFDLLLTTKQSMGVHERHRPGHWLLANVRYR